MGIKQLIKNCTPYGISLITLLLIFFFVLNGYHLNWKIPLVYAGDSLFAITAIKNIIDSGWFLTNPYLSYPGIYQLYDFPTVDNFNFLIQLLMSFFTHNPFVILNVFYFLTYIMSAFTALYVFKKISLSTPFAIVASILFAILPYHFCRNEAHLYLSSYFAVPIWLLLAFKIINDQPFIGYFKNHYFNRLILFIMLLIIVNSGVYYTFFGLSYIFIAGIFASVSMRNKQGLIRGLKIIILSGLIAYVNLLPNIIFFHEHGKNQEVAQRDALDSEAFSTNISQFLMPVENNRIGFLRHIREKYDHDFSFFNTPGASDSAPGVLGSLGFLASLAFVLFARSVKTGKNLYNASLFNLAGILLASFGSFGTIFAFFVTAEIRCYYRIAPYLGFLSLFVFFKLIQFLTKKYDLKSKTIAVIAAILLAFGILDQTTANDVIPKVSINQMTLESDQAFVAKIEKALPPGSAVFEIPYIAFPESPPLNNMQAYDLFRPYLNSHSLVWSFGSMNGRPAAIWQKQVMALPPAEMIKTIVLSGFSGIYIDRAGYVDHGQAIEVQLSRLLQESPIVSQNGEFSFFSLLWYKGQLQQAYGNKWDQAVVHARQPFFGKTN